MPSSFQAQLKRVKERIKKKASPANVLPHLIRIAEEAVEELKDSTPRSDDGDDHLADGWKYEVDTDVSGTTIRVYNDHPRAQGGRDSVLSMLEFGTTDHWVEPVNAPVMRWIDKETDDVYFSKGHEVSGIAPEAMIAKARFNAERKLEALRARMATT